MSNSALDPLLEGIAPELLVPPANALRLALHPDGLAPRILNFGEWRGHLLGRVARELQSTGDPALAELYEELLGYPAPAGSAQDADSPEASAIMVQLRLATRDGGELTFFSTVTTFGTAVDVTLAELSVEAFFPADTTTAERLANPG
jgi:hypothetical protein